MSANQLVHSRLNLKAGLVMDHDEASFPSNPKLGTMVVKGKSLYVYLEISGLTTWYPMIRNTASTYVHSQATGSTSWVINHNLNDSDIWYQVQDFDGNIISVGSVEKSFDNNTLTINFYDEETGTVLIVGTNELDVPEIKAELISVGSNVKITTSGFYVNNVLIGNGVGGGISQLTLDTAIATETSARTAADATLTTNIATLNTDLVTETTRAISAESTLTSALAGKANLAGSSTQDFATKDLTISGNLTVTGTNTTVHSTTVTTDDNIIVLNENEVGAGVTAGKSGVEVDRGTLPNYQFVFNETIDMFQVGEVGNLETLASQNYVQAYAAELGHVHPNTPYDTIFSVFDKPTASESVCRFRTSRAFTIAANLTGSIAIAAVAATSSSVFTIKKNGSAVATITFAAAGTTATFSTQAAIVFNVGDKMDVVAPAVADATLADIDFSIVATLN